MYFQTANYMTWMALGLPKFDSLPLSHFLSFPIHSFLLASFLFNMQVIYFFFSNLLIILFVLVYFYSFSGPFPIICFLFLLPSILS
jgi:hypothetical protein